MCFYLSIVIGLCLLLKTLEGVNLNYSLIEKTGKICLGRDSCKNQSRNARGPEGIENDWEKQNCFCDDLCLTYGDCCIDALALASFHDPGGARNSFVHFECINLKHYGNIYMKSSCPASWNISNIRLACENNNDDDPFGSTPVTNSDSGFTYRNYYCAVCNKDAKTIQFWKQRLECPTLTDRFKNITEEFVFESLKVNDRGRWGLEVDMGGGIPVFHECTVNPTVPDTLVHFIRSCPGQGIVGFCPGFSPNGKKVLCEAYMGLVYDINAVYRNVHCAMCHGVTLDQLICLNLGSLSRFNWQRNFNVFSFAVLFDFSGGIQRLVGKKCKREGELYDPFFKKCRNVFCGIDDQIYSNGRCVSITFLANTLTTTIISMNSLTSIVAATSTTSTPIMSAPSSRNGTSTSLLTTTLTFTSSSSTKEAKARFAYCSKIQLEPGEFHLLSNGSIFINAYNRILEDEFALKKDKIVICAFDEDLGASNKFSPTMGSVTLICLGISVICLILHILASFLVTELQNLSGKNLLSLSVALLGGYICFIYAMFAEKECFITALFMYFFFLSSFFWSMIIGIDVCRSLKLATTELRLSSGIQWKKFGIYSVIGWILPLLLTILVIIIEKSNRIARNFRPGFGNGSICWFSNKLALFLYFVLPFSIVMVINVVLFIISFFIVFDTTRNSSKMTALSPKINFYLYLRLVILMGLSWITGLVAGFADVEALWYVFVGLNTLQGLFIFLAFTCTRKIFGSIKGQILKTKVVTEDFLSWLWTSHSSASSVSVAPNEIVTF